MVREPRAGFHVARWGGFVTGIDHGIITSHTPMLPIKDIKKDVISLI
jgi:hypothetical protein